MDQTPITGSAAMKLGRGSNGEPSSPDASGETGEPASSVFVLGVFGAIFIGRTGRGQRMQN